MKEADSQIFVFTAGNSAARSHLDDSIINSVSRELVYEHFQKSLHSELSVIEQEHGFYAWGAVPGKQNTGRWERLKVSDWVLCVFDSTYKYLARIVSKYDNPECARAIWGNDPSGKTWQLMYFLTKPREIDVPLTALSSLLSERYMGFTRTSDERLDEIRELYGSIDNFINSVFVENTPVRVETLSENYFLIRSNPNSHWSDEEGKIYRFGSSVPNYRKLISGGKVVVDSKVQGSVRIIGYGKAAPAIEKEPYETEQRTNKSFETNITNWRSIEPPKVVSSELKTELSKIDGYNVQHAIRPISEELYNKLITEEIMDRVGNDSRTGEIVDHFSNSLMASNIEFGTNHEQLVRAFVASLICKPLVILTGLSGSGKTQLAIRFGEWLGEKNLYVAAVRPDWTGSEYLFGYEDALQSSDENGNKAWHVPPVLEFLLQAARNADQPYLLVLDEMNLAHVERYFADVLSGMESRKPCLPNLDRLSDGTWRINEQEKYITIPDNIFIVGTVNIDETTYMFSPKVLDRANTFEFRVTDSDLKEEYKPPSKCATSPEALRQAFLAEARSLGSYNSTDYSSSQSIGDTLRSCHRILAKYGFEFGHRVFSESLRFARIFREAGENDRNTVIDRIVLQKILPKLHGSRRKLEPLLIDLIGFASDTNFDGTKNVEPEAIDIEDADLPSSCSKLVRMLEALRANQFVSFTE
ncbi:MAG: AAA family ATPase [Gammaproteobacteria bacterium]